MEKNKKKFALIPVVIMFIIGGLLFWHNQRALGGIITRDESVQDNAIRVYDFFATSTLPGVAIGTATTTTATSTNVNSYFVNGRLENGTLDIRGAKKVELILAVASTTTSGDISAPQGRFKFQVTEDRVTWYDWNKLKSGDTSATATSAPILGNLTSTSTFAMDLTNDTFSALRCIVTIIDAGSFTCKAIVEY